ncbi:MAG: tetratricopeptide repeat protein [Bacteroidales bacterium]|nr:tetratricopeptide repeat protein [Bacteroidales bacterium]
MKRVFNILILSFLTTFIFAQDETRVIDSLESVMAKQEGREKVETMMELSKAFFDYSFDECIDWGEKAIQEATRFQDEELMAKSYWRIGIRYLDHYEFDLALENFNKALDFLKDKDDSDLLMRVLNTKGRVELFMGEMDSALITYQRALKVSNSIGDELNCADVINNLAYIYFQQDDLEKALECFQDARQRYAMVQDTLSMAQCDNNISNIYVQRQQFDKAQTLLQKAIPVFEQNEDEASLAHAYQNLGTVYATGSVNLDSAMFYLHKSIVCAENVSDQITLIEDELELAGVMRQLNRDGEAIGLYQSALHSSEAMGYTIGMMEAYKNLGIHYNIVGDFTTSAVYLKRCMDLALEKGHQLYVNTVRPYLIADYARLGQLMEMKKELGLMQDEYLGIVNENNALSDELSRVQSNVEGLLEQYESQSEQIETLQTQRNHYRLAFFGLLAIALFALALLIAYKIVRKKRAKV